MGEKNSMGIWVVKPMAPRIMADPVIR
jgi:hypothetical protein